LVTFGQLSQCIAHAVIVPIRLVGIGFQFAVVGRVRNPIKVAVHFDRMVAVLLSSSNSSIALAGSRTPKAVDSVALYGVPGEDHIPVGAGCKRLDRPAADLGPVYICLP